MTPSRTFSRWNPWRGLGELPEGVWIVCAVTFVNRMGSMAVPFLVLYLTSVLDFTPAEAGGALALYGAGALVSAPLSGRLCDRLGAVRVMAASLFLSGAILLAFPFARTPPAVLAALVGLALAGEAFRPASGALLAGLAEPGRRKAVFALSRLAVNLGMSVGPAVGGFLAAVHFPALFWVDGSTSLLAGLLLLWRPPRGSAPPGPSPPPRSVTALRDPRFLLFLFGSVLVSAVFCQHFGALPLHLVRDLGLPESVYGALFTINTVLIVLLEVRLNLALAAWPHGRTLLAGALLTGIGFGALGWCGAAWQVAAMAVVWTFGEMILFPSLAATVADAAPEERRGEYMGLFTMAFALAFSVAPWLGTLVLERAGAGALWGGCFAVAAAGGLLLATVAGGGPATSPSPPRSGRRGSPPSDHP